jgi:hypothetical protein
MQALAAYYYQSARLNKGYLGAMPGQAWQCLPVEPVTLHSCALVVVEHYLLPGSDYDLTLR